MIDYEKMSRKELMEMRAQIDRAIAAVAEREKREALRAAEEAARERGFTLEELVGSAAGSRRGRPTPPAPASARYRNPQNPSQTWSGRGRRPAWIKEAEKQGRSLDEMRIA
ncbi:H-NS family nucleoid-associated regulatory protein [Rubellimicrobium sp. CFH 75288]|uniref:H-NS histone family protein n=1 Tax=Rubellimicrobium sp. CFH 75288 TaxID=2697034 RepID=UPI001412643F|nr:H-NS histone family protein [Rubellimicrobium sp. CFH 75288]NAZ37397.1 H-NS histone family protein [Rubellimicrobium sp. CFH 75288]